MRHSILSAALAAAVLTSAGSAAIAQATPETDPPAVGTDQDTIQTPPERVCTDEATGAPEPCDTLSEQLDATGGVIAPPPGIDPEITAPAPDPMPGTTPVIPPSAVPTDPQSEGPVVPK
ncbi:hypothetical protein [Chthonobacter rhizosphaerae]|uniref:hypothetical protein n=1 Tax=Chthonobacter rhizosphaerae TaxID=2735553 RepID=UPI0015EF70C5|nr:hypothetical protein [Chthonobacter rhizosphaerae]